MSCSNCRRRVFLAAVVASQLVASACRQDESTVIRLQQIMNQAPHSVSDWAASAPDQLFDAQSIFDYIDGHAEVYLAYTMQRCIARRYSGPESDIVLDVFEMASSTDAFGVFTYDLDGEEVEIGQGSRFRYGWLSFWKGPFFVSIYADGEGPDVEAAVLDLGRSLARAISETGELPPLVGALPKRGLETSTIRYLYHPQILSTHTTIPLDNPLGITASSPAVLAHYEMSGRRARVLVVDYPTRSEAEAALQAADTIFDSIRGGQREPDENPTPYAARLSDRVLMMTLNADDQSLADELMNTQPEDQP